MKNIGQQDISHQNGDENDDDAQVLFQKIFKHRSFLLRY